MYGGELGHHRACLNLKLTYESLARLGIEKLLVRDSLPGESLCCVLEQDIFIPCFQPRKTEIRLDTIEKLLIGT